MFTSSIVEVPDTFYKNKIIKFINSFNDLLIDFSVHHHSLEECEYFSVNKRWLKLYECVPMVDVSFTDFELMKNSLEEQFKLLYDNLSLTFVNYDINDLFLIRTRDTHIPINVIMTNFDKIIKVERNKILYAIRENELVTLKGRSFIYEKFAETLDNLTEKLS